MENNTDNIKVIKVTKVAAPKAKRIKTTKVQLPIETEESYSSMPTLESQVTQYIEIVNKQKKDLAFKDCQLNKLHEAIDSFREHLDEDLNPRPIKKFLIFTIKNYKEIIEIIKLLISIRNENKRYK